MVNPVRIHIPDKDGKLYSVVVHPDKLYGDRLGSELIHQYGKRGLKSITPRQALIISESDIFLPCGKLQEYTRINGDNYKTAEVIRRIEKITDTRIYSKRQNRILKHFQNTTLTIPQEEICL